MVNIALHLHLYQVKSESNPAGLAPGIELAGDLLAKMLHSGYLPIALETLLLRAQLKAASGNIQASLADTLSALELGEPEGIISMIVEEGQSIAQFLATLLERRSLGPAQTGFLKTILAAFPIPRSPEKPLTEVKAMIEPLTDRDLDVLRLIADGLKYEEIAGKLFISLNTVRTYVKAGYGKLDLNTRTSAIAVARQHKHI